MFIGSNIVVNAMFLPCCLLKRSGVSTFNPGLGEVFDPQIKSGTVSYLIWWANEWPCFWGVAF